MLLSFEATPTITITTPIRARVVTTTTPTEVTKPGNNSNSSHPGLLNNRVDTKDVVSCVERMATVLDGALSYKHCPLVLSLRLAMTLLRLLRGIHEQSWQRRMCIFQTIGFSTVARHITL